MPLGKIDKKIHIISAIFTVKHFCKYFKNNMMFYINFRQYQNQQFSCRVYRRHNLYKIISEIMPASEIANDIDFDYYPEV